MSSRKSEVSKSSPVCNLINTPKLRQRRKPIENPSTKLLPPAQRIKYPKVNSAYPRLTERLKKSNASDEEDNAEKDERTTDLEIQFQKIKIDNLNSENKSKNKVNERKKVDIGQSLVQYCNFEEKKVVKVAPHIRKKEVIYDTVDAWSRRGESERPRYRPLVFGGTYPIDAPLKNNSIVKDRNISKTFDVDLPTEL